MSAHDHPHPLPVPTFRDLLAAAEAARRISTPPPRPTVSDEDAA